MRHCTDAIGWLCWNWDFAAGYICAVIVAAITKRLFPTGADR